MIIKGFEEGLGGEMLEVSCKKEEVPDQIEQDSKGRGRCISGKL